MTINSCFDNKDFAKYLESKNEKELVIVGLQTDFCIDATIKSAFERGYHVIVPKGTNSTFDNKYISKEKIYKYFNEWVWPDAFAECVSISKVISLMNNK